MNPNQWPKLSESLQFEDHPQACKSCGHGDKTDDGTILQRWIEHDAQDKPTNVIVILCEPCAKRLVEPHPRLYSKLDGNRPVPGAMPNMCTDCHWRLALRCQHPALKSNGGPGLNITVAEPIRGFMDGRDPKTGQRTGGYFERWLSPARACAGRKVVEPVNDGTWKPSERSER